MLESLKGWIIDPDTQAQKTIDNYENQRLSIEDAIESGLLNNRAGQIFLDYGDVIMGPPVTLPSSLVGIREAIKGNFDSKEMQRTATAGFYAGFVGQGIEYTQIISNADYQLSMIITSAKGVNSINNPLSYLLFIKDFSLTQTIDAAKAGLQDAWNGIYDSAIGRKIGAGTFNYLLMTIGGAQLKGKGNACEAVESGTGTKDIYRAVSPEEFDDIFATGGFRARPDGRSFQAKEFGNSFDETLEFANKPINLDKAAIVKVTIPENVYNQLHHMNLDRAIFKSGTPVVEPEMLDMFNESIISIEHAF